MIKEIVFDFDGTIALSFELTIEVLSELINKLGYRRINNEDLMVFRNEGWRSTLDRINFPLWRIPKVLIMAQKEINLQIDKVKAVAGLREVLFQLKEKGFILGILTSNSKENVEKFCRKNKLDIFEYIYSEKSLFGKEKKIKKLLKDRKLNKDEMLYIGDEVRDWEACQKIGVEMIGVSWGFNDRKFFEKVGIKKIIDRPEEIIEII